MIFTQNPTHFFGIVVKNVTLDRVKQYQDRFR